MKFLILLTILLCFCACTNSPSKEEIDRIKSQRPEDSVPEHLRAKTDLESLFPTQGAVDIPDEGFGDEQVTAPPLQDVSDEDIVWTDPDNPDQNLGEVESAFSKPIKDSWQLSFQSAQRLAYAEGKALMIWFTDSTRSPICKRLDREVFSTHEFKKWSDENVVKLRVDLSPRERDSKLRDAKLRYAQALRKKFSVSGNPTVIMLDFNHQSAGRYVGFRSGEGAYYLGRLEQAGRVINEQYFTWLPKLNNKGYRLWEGSNGVALLARLTHYKNGVLQVVEPNGRKTSFHERNLSSKDKKWVAAQKAKRGR